ncbi:MULTISPECIES: hypothetical protein [Mycobacterium]|uniref:hypothetical protein n=1 Tax=Mycobacterium TaxID=1763 RepID=UPI001EF07D4A|nr:MULTISPECIES: hypothetical protein [Mycobacterium]
MSRWPNSPRAYTWQWDNAQAAEERARRADVLQRAENEFDSTPGIIRVIPVRRAM